MLPAPKGATEAYFAALVHRPQKKGLFSRQGPIARFFTLERSIDLADSGPGSVLCEWTSSDIHSNMGDGPEPTLEAFFATVCNMIAR